MQNDDGKSKDPIKLGPIGGKITPTEPGPGDHNKPGDEDEDGDGDGKPGRGDGKDHDGGGHDHDSDGDDSHNLNLGSHVKAKLDVQLMFLKKTAPAGLIVGINTLDKKNPGLATTNDKGNVSFEVKPGTYVVRANGNIGEIPVKGEQQLDLKAGRSSEVLTLSALARTQEVEISGSYFVTDQDWGNANETSGWRNFSFKLVVSESVKESKSNVVKLPVDGEVLFRMTASTSWQKGGTVALALTTELFAGTSASSSDRIGYKIFTHTLNPGETEHSPVNPHGFPYYVVTTNPGDSYIVKYTCKNTTVWG